MLPRKTYSLRRYRSGILGWKNSKTFRSVQTVSRELRSYEYFPCQWKVCPSIRSRPSRSMPRPRKAASSLSPKSRPTTPTRFTGTKNDAATEKNDALPPRTRSARPKGVSTVSYATLPTTRMDTLRSGGLRARCGLFQVLPDDRGQLALHRLGHQLRGG